MIVTTTDIIQGAEVQEYLGIVTAEVVYGSNALRSYRNQQWKKLCILSHDMLT